MTAELPEAERQAACPTRDELVALCDRALVPQDRWHDRDSAGAQKQVGQLRALLLAGCDFELEPYGEPCVSDDRTWWIQVTYKGFAWFEESEPTSETFYLPTEERLATAGDRDWY